MKRLVCATALLAFVAAAGAAQAQVTKPIRYTWIATSCETWNCAAAALVMANGKPDVIVLPTKNEARPWLVLKRVEEGSLYIPETEPFACEVFDHLDGAAAHFSAMDGCHAPLILNVPDGRVVVTSLIDCANAGKRRAVQ